MGVPPPAPRAPGRSKSLEATPERIRAAAIAAFAEDGYGATTTRSIAQQLGMSGAALYLHYPSKEALLFEISRGGHEEALAVVLESDQPTASPSDRLRRVVHAFAKWQAVNSKLARVLQYELRSLEEGHLQVILTIRRQTSGVLESIITHGYRVGEFRASDPPGALLAISSLCVDTCRWFPSQSYPDAEQVAEFYGDVALRIVGAATMRSANVT